MADAFEAGDFLRAAAGGEGGFGAVQREDDAIGGKELGLGEGGFGGQGIMAQQKRRAQGVPCFGMVGGDTAALDQQALGEVDLPCGQTQDAEGEEGFGAFGVAVEDGFVGRDGFGGFTCRTEGFGQSEGNFVPERQALLHRAHQAARGIAVPGVFGLDGAVEDGGGIQVSRFRHRPRLCAR